MGEWSLKGEPFGRSAVCKPGEIVIRAILQPLLTGTREDCINLENPFPWGPQIVPGVFRLLMYDLTPLHSCKCAVEVPALLPHGL